ncbi:uncharacterized protein LOC119722531 [Patiria miniata]|uniref:C-type lectin domain-containing protein n=1 Tax=Patiria miniata TaxID=46514 RepID=A0A913ZCI1_PATMI|nr:uncharacterized protein LOC119722531 [Patiria miniata]
MIWVNVFVVVSASAMVGAYLGPWVCVPVQDKALACPPDWQVFGDFCFRLSGNERKGSWQESIDVCRDLGGEMAAPQSSEENDFISTLEESDVAWIACTLNSPGVWVCDGREPGTQMDFLGWDGPQPPHDSRKSCGSIKGRWQARPCDDDHRAVCVRPVACVYHPIPGASAKHLRIRQDTCIQLTGTEAGGTTTGQSRCLTGHVIKEFAVQSVNGCAARCISEPECLSFNVLSNGEELMCELNDSNGSEDSDEFYESENCILYHLE